MQNVNVIGKWQHSCHKYFIILRILSDINYSLYPYWLLDVIYVHANNQRDGITISFKKYFKGKLIRLVLTSASKILYFQTFTKSSNFTKSSIVDLNVKLSTNHCMWKKSLWLNVLSKRAIFLKFINLEHVTSLNFCYVNPSMLVSVVNFIFHLKCFHHMLKLYHIINITSYIMQIN